MLTKQQIEQAYQDDIQHAEQLKQKSVMHLKANIKSYIEHALGIDWI